MKIQNPKSKIQKLIIAVDGRHAKVQLGKRSCFIALDKKPLLWAISRVVYNPHALRSITVRMCETTFSGTRQVIATVNTLAWELKIKVNGVRQMRALYSKEPNITL